MQVAPRYVTLPQLFKNSVYKVPEYQRGYAWTQRQLDDLWNDIEGSDGSAQHFTGMIVVEAREERSLGERAMQDQRILELIDGQQRLTTLILLIQAIIAELRALDTPEARLQADRLAEKYIGSPGSFRLVLNEDSRTYFEHLLATGEPPLQTENGSQQNIFRAARFFRDKLAELTSERGEWLESVSAIARRVESNLKFIHVQVDDDTEAGKMFEVMNNRGKPLSDVDRLKNYLMYLANKISMPPDAVKGIATLWGDIYKQVMRASRDGEAAIPTESKLLRTHWVLYQDATPAPDHELSISQTSAYEMRVNVDPRLDSGRADNRLAKEIDHYTRHLAMSAHAFADLLNPDRTGVFSWVEDEGLRAQISHHVGSFSRMDYITPPLPLLLAAYLRLRERPEKLCELIAVLSSFCFRAYKLCRHGELSAMPLFHRLARQVHEADEEDLEESIDEIIANVRHWTRSHASDADVAVALSAPDFFGEHTATELRYLFYELELYKRRGARQQADWKDFSDDTRTTIEHIWPREGAWLGGTAESHLTNRDRLGNLTVAVSGRVASGDEFARKRTKYGRSALLVESELERYQEWSPAVVDEREAEITRFVLGRWPA
jgi:hypothetical protein